MRIPRDINSETLINLLGRWGYRKTRQKESHIRLTRESEKGPHKITIPAHNPIRIGTIHDILQDVALHLETSIEKILEKL